MKENSTTKNWRCTEKSCKARVTTTLALTVVRADTDHDHEGKSVQTHLLRQACKEKAKSNISDRPRTIILTEAAQMNHTDAITLPDINSVRRSIWMQRRKMYPKLPTNLLESLDAVAQITSKETTLIEVDEESKIVGIFDTNAIRKTNYCQNLFSDGTFKSCPKFFRQIYSVLTFINGSYVPLSFFLLPNQKEATYYKMFQQFRKVYESVTGTAMENKTLHLDFEKAAHNGANQAMPGTKIRGCFFHLKQSWWRSIQELGLSCQYKDPKSEVGEFLKSTFGLPLLNMEEVAESFAFDVIENSPEGDAITEYLDYLTRTYITSSSKFPPCLWAGIDSEEKRTTNGCEAFHKHINSLFYAPHPSIFELFEKLEEITLESTFKLQSNENPRKLTTQEKRKQEQINFLKLQYSTEKISRRHFIEAMGKLSLPVTNFYALFYFFL